MNTPTPDASASMRITRRTALACTLLSLSRGAGAQQAYPTRPVTFVVPYPPGTGNDLVARILANKLPSLIGQSIVPDNRPGASSLVATEYTKRAPPDGYTLLLSSVSFSILPHTMNAKYGLADFTPVAMIGKLPFTLLVSNSVPVKTARELAAYINARPGQLSGAQGGPTGTTYYLLESFKRETGAKMVSVPYKGTTDALIDLQADRVQLLFAPITTALQALRAGSAKVLGVTGTARTTIMPELPTFSEQGFKTLEISTWFGLLGPARMPEQIVTTMSGAVAKALASKDVSEALLGQGIVPEYGDAADLKKIIVDDMAMWARLVKESGIKQ